MKKFLTILMALTLMLTLFAGCGAKTTTSDGNDKKVEASAKGSKDQEAIIADLKKELNIDGYEAQVAAELKADQEFIATTNQVNLDIDEYVNAIAKKYKWDIGDVTVDGDKAVAKVTMTSPDFNAMDTLLDEKIEAFKASNDVSTMTEQDLMKALGEMMLEIVKADDLPLETQDFDIDYIKEGNTWKMADYDGVEQEMIDAQAIDDAA